MSEAIDSVEPSVAREKSPAIPAGRRLLSIFSGSVGNLVEWYDWYVYSSFSIYFARSFFPKGDLTAQLLNTAGVFALGFLVRPVGGWVLGWYADRYGRKAALTGSVLLMCLGSLLIALTPGYGTIGIAAPALLLFARLLQGLSVGGDLDLRGTKITALPEGLSVGRCLYLDGTKIDALPEGLRVGGNLDLRGTKITALPKGLRVGGRLYLEGTPITVLPEGLKVGGKIVGGPQPPRGSVAAAIARIWRPAAWL